MKSSLQVFVQLLIIITTHGAKIIFLLPIASSSDKIVFDPLIKILALSDNDVTVVSPVASPNLPTSVREIHPATLEEFGFEPNLKGKDFLEKIAELKSSYFPILWNTSVVEFGCHRLYQDVEIKYLLRGLKKFDLAIVSGVQNECSLGLVSAFRIPHIYLTTMPPTNYVVGRLGHWFPTSFVPSPFTAFGDKMTFVERTMNFIVETVLVFAAKHVLYPQYEAIYRGYLGEDTPGIEEIEDTVGVILMNTNYVMSHPRPLMPNVIEVGGLHCRPARPLPTELDKFLHETQEGFIFVSLGSLVQAKDIPLPIQNLFLKVFAKVDERVIWKWDGEGLKVPENVRLTPWIPQQDILGHRNIKLFISNGNLLSSQEAIYHGVPLLGIPLTREDDLNMLQAEKAGFARTWEILDMNQTRLEELIDRMLIEPQYKAQVRRLSKMHRDSPDISLDKALFWIDYVIRNKGAPNLRSSAKDLNYFQYHSIDVIAFLISILLLLLCFLFCAISKLLCRTTSDITKLEPLVSSTNAEDEKEDGACDNNHFSKKCD